MVQNSHTITKQQFKRVTYGKASWYGKKFNGRKTASGELFDSNKRTAAHRTLPFNTMVRVTDIISNRSDIVRINDRGPFSGNRIIDISYASAKKVGLVKRGVADVKVEIVGSSGKINKRLLSLTSPNRACVGDNCIAKIAKSSSNPIKPYSLWAKNRIGSKDKPIIESVYSEKQPNTNYNISSVDRFPKIDTHSQKVSIQVGAFRKYSGAEIYMRRYSMLSSQYKAVIKNGQKDAIPIFRVQIEGFGDELEAKKFIAKHKYSLTGAFLVRR